MRGSVDQSSKDAAAIDEACRQLRPLFFNVISWTERGPITNNPKTEFEAALARVESFVSDNDGHPMAELVRKAAIPVLRRALPPKGRHGRHSDLNAPRNRAIAETVTLIRGRFRLSLEQASAVVSDALKSLALEHTRVF